MRNNTDRVVFYRYIHICFILATILKQIHKHSQMGRYYKSAEPKENVWHRVSAKRRKCQLLFRRSRSSPLCLEIGCSSSNIHLSIRDENMGANLPF